MIKKQFTLYVENRPGTLAAVTKRLAAAKVNIDGISVSESTDVALIQIVAADARLAKKVLDRARISYTVQDVVVLCLENRPGSLSRVVAKFAKEGVNINYVYATGCECAAGCDCYSYVVISAPNLKKVESVWKPISARPARKKPV